MRSPRTISRASVNPAAILSKARFMLFPLRASGGYVALLNLPPGAGPDSSRRPAVNKRVGAARQSPEFLGHHAQADDGVVSHLA